MTFELLHSLIVAAIYVLLGRWLLRRRLSNLRDAAFALLNLAGVYGIFFQGQGPYFQFVYVVYLCWVGIQYVMLRAFAQRTGALPWLAFFTPLASLLILRYAPPAILVARGAQLPATAYFVGVSYLAFRSSHLVIQVRNRLVAPPSLWNYLSFCFFVPTLEVGPISPYSLFARGLAAPPVEIPVAQAGLRLLVGMVKYQILAVLCNQLGYASLLQDDHYHSWVDLPAAAIFYYLYLYCNFSGFCDMAIGAAGFMGMPVQENFANPLAARNMREFWNRWHITLSQWMRDLVFAPLSKLLVSWLGPGNVNHAVAIAVFVVFLLIGVWHGVGWNYAIFGLCQAVGVVANHYYSIGLKKWLGRQGFRAYMENRWIHVVAVGSTFCYYAGSLIFFANTLPQVKEIIHVLH